MSGIDEMLPDDLHQLKGTDLCGNGKFHGERSCSIPEATAVVKANSAR